MSGEEGGCDDDGQLEMRGVVTSRGGNPNGSEIVSVRMRMRVQVKRKRRS